MFVRHLVMFSGGTASWATAKRVVAEHGTDGVALLFADTRYEDEDLYRFLPEAAANIGAPLFRVCDGRTPWQVFRDVRFVGNSHVDPCSKLLKRHLSNKWRDEHCDPSTATCYVGLDWTELHRYAGTQKKPGLRDRMAAQGWTYKAPMCERPYLSKDQMNNWLRCEGIEPPRMYSEGFQHNNCGGFCCKAGHAHFRHYLRVRPERYAQDEAAEQDMIAMLGRDATVLRDRRGGTTKPLSLLEFRERIERQEDTPLFDEEWGGCGCAIDDSEPA